MAKRKALQIGAGMVGRCIVNDIIKDFDVTVLDMSDSNLEETKRLFPDAKTVKGSALDEELFQEVSKDVDIVTAAMPGTVGYKVTEIAMKYGKKLASVSSMHGRSDEPYDKIGKETGGLGISMIGFEPGMSNFFAGRGYHLLDKCEEMYVYVGGIPYNPRPPFNYTTTWSLTDNLNQFAQPSTVVRDGQEVVLKALSELKDFQIEDYPTMEAFTSNGLGSLFRSFHDVPNMAAYTVRWPGLTEQMRFLVNLDLFDWEPRKIAKHDLVPREILFSLFADKYKKLPGDLDLSIMRIITKGYKGDDAVQHTWEIAQVEKTESGYTSMAWCTASTCGIFARAMCEGRIKGCGMVSAEKLAADDDFYNWVMAEQDKRGVHYKQKIDIKKDAKKKWNRG